MIEFWATDEALRRAAARQEAREPRVYTPWQTAALQAVRTQRRAARRGIALGSGELVGVVDHYLDQRPRR